MPPAEDKLTELRERYEKSVLDEIRGVKDKIDKVDVEVNGIKLSLAQANLTDIKIDVAEMKRTLSKHDPERIESELRKLEADLKQQRKDDDERIDKLEKFQTRALAILTFLNVLLGIFAIFKDYIMGKPKAAPSPTQTGMVIWENLHYLIAHTIPFFN